MCDFPSETDEIFIILTFSLSYCIRIISPQQYTRKKQIRNQYFLIKLKSILRPIFFKISPDSTIYGLRFQRYCSLEIMVLTLLRSRQILFQKEELVRFQKSRFLLNQKMLIFIQIFFLHDWGGMTLMQVFFTIRFFMVKKIIRLYVHLAKRPLKHKITFGVMSCIVSFLQ